MPRTLAGQRRDGKPHRLDPGELPVLEVPVGVREIRKVVWVPDVLCRKPRVDPARELDHLVGLRLLHAREGQDLGEDVGRGHEGMLCRGARARNTRGVVRGTSLGHHGRQ